MKVIIGSKNVTSLIGDISLTSSDELNGEELSFSSLLLHDVGEIVKITDGGKNGNTIRYMGVITSVEQNARPPHSYQCVDFSRNLKSEEIIQFKKTRADVCIKKLLKRLGVKCQVCSMGVKISKIYKDTALNILDDILKIQKEKTGYSYYYEVRGAKLVVERKRQRKIYPSFIISSEEPVTFSIEDLKNHIKVTSGNSTLAEAWSPNSVKALGTMQETINVSNKTKKGSALALAKRELKKTNRIAGSKTVSILCTSGYWSIRKNRLIYINDGRLKGWYEIKSCSHTIESDKHKFDLEVSWSGAFK